MPTIKGAFKLFTYSGIGVYIHWSWLIVAYIGIKVRTQTYSSPVYNALEYLSLFGIVLIHEFGHQLACRQVGGKTHNIVLWPLGGVAFVSPPQRPGAELWSIAAGPLVNVALIPIFSLFWSAGYHLGWYETHLDIYRLARNVWYINLGLLIFNMLPVYPLDGGQILRSLLWFVFGRINSLIIACIVGLLGLAALIVLMVVKHSSAVGTTQIYWTIAIGFFIAMNCWGGLKQAMEMMRLAKLPRREGFACPSCKMAPPDGALWGCGQCGKPFDIFLTLGVCPNCARQFEKIPCLDCGTFSTIAEWKITPPINEKTA